jgi:hypothetical protein
MFGRRAVGPDDAEISARHYIGCLAAAFLTIFALIWLYTATLPMAFLTRDYPSWLAKRSMLASCETGSIAFFGDSRAMAGIDPAYLPFATSNFAFAGSTPIEAYFATQQMLRCRTLPKAIVLAYSAGNYMSDSDYWRISAQVGVLNYADIRAVRRESRLLHDDEIDRLASNEHLAPPIHDALVAARFPSFYFGSLIDGFGFARYFINRATVGAIRTARGHALFGIAPGSDAVASESALSRFAPSPVVNAYLQSILAAVAQKKIAVVFVSPPLNEATCRVMNPSLRSALAAYLRQVVATDRQAQIVGPIMPCWPDRFFGDGFHLNAMGAKRYTTLIGQWVRPTAPQLGSAARIGER